MIEKLPFSMQMIFQLNKIEKACFGKEAWTIANLRGEYENDFSHMFGEKTEDGTVVGYACVRTLYEEAQLCNVAVLPEYRRQGIATPAGNSLGVCQGAGVRAVRIGSQHSQHRRNRTVQEMRFRNSRHSPQFLQAHQTLSHTRRLHNGKGVLICEPLSRATAANGFAPYCGVLCTFRKFIFDETAFIFFNAFIESVFFTPKPLGKAYFVRIYRKK